MNSDLCLPGVRGVGDLGGIIIIIILMVIIFDCGDLSTIRALFFFTMVELIEFSQDFLATGNKNYLVLYVHKGWRSSLKLLQELLHRFSRKLQRCFEPRPGLGWSWLHVAEAGLA